MMTMWRIAFAAALSAALFIGACGGADDNGMTLEEYLREFDRISDESETRTDEASDAVAELPEDPSVEQVKEALGPLYAEFADVINDFQTELAGLEPPDEVQDEHDTIVGAFGQFEQEFEQTREDIESATTREEIVELSEQFGESESARDATDRLEAACRELQRLADENEVDVDLECEDE